MMITYEHIVLILACLIGFGLLMYICLDGFDLGVGIIFPWAPNDQIRGVMFSSVAPVWDGNATWLIYVGAVLFAAFPIAYSIILPALYLPIMLMAAAFIFRGLAFEFRLKASKKSRWIWDAAFALGSTAAAFLQGAMLGGVIEGFEVVDDRFAGNSMDWLSSFAIISGMGLIMGYALLGAAWVVYKTKGQTHDWARQIMKPILVIVGFFLVIISINTPLEHEAIAKRWFSLPNFFYLLPVPFLSAVCFFGILYGIYKRIDRLPFISTLGLYVLSFLGLAISLYPNIIMPDISIWDAAASEQSLDLLFYVLLISLPIVLGYTYFIYAIFREKVDEDTHHYK